MQITRDTIIADLLNTDFQQDAVPVLQEMGMHCLGCVMASSETIGEACDAHAVDADDIIARLTALANR